MSLQDDDEQHEQQAVDDSMDNDGRTARLHVHEVHRAVPAGHLQDASRAQQREQRRRDDRRRPILHLLPSNCSFSYKSLLDKCERRTKQEAQPWMLLLRLWRDRRITRKICSLDKKMAEKKGIGHRVRFHVSTGVEGITESVDWLIGGGRRSTPS
uniref:Uncharacterized protein n=1 Tax=Leersia perrieri TaxID=77586 RepID=A0A0D9V7T4_9ORYZ